MSTRCYPRLNITISSRSVASLLVNREWRKSACHIPSYCISMIGPMGRFSHRVAISVSLFLSLFFVRDNSKHPLLEVVETSGQRHIPNIGLRWHNLFDLICLNVGSYSRKSLRTFHCVLGFWIEMPPSPPIPNYHHHHHQNPTNTTTITIETTEQNLKLSTHTTITLTPITIALRRIS